MAGSVLGTRAAYRMPWRPGPAWLFSARDVAAMRAFLHEYGTVHAVLTGLMEPRPTVGLGSSFRPRSDGIKLLGTYITPYVLAHPVPVRVNVLSRTASYLYMWRT